MNKGTKASRPVVVCKSVVGLISYIQARRNTAHSLVKIGVDGGQGSLKVTLNLQDDCSSTTFKDSGARQTFVVALATDVPENYNNISVIWAHLNLSSVKAMIVGTDQISCLQDKIFS